MGLLVDIHGGAGNIYRMRNQTAAQQLRNFRSVVRNNETFETRTVEGAARNEVQFEAALALDNETVVTTVEV
jgi:hypothetical protein